MAIQPVQFNREITNDSQSMRAVKPYREAEGAVSTKNLVKPLPPKGHLVDDNLGTGIKYFFKDIGYDMKSVKDGFKGTANDHQSGRLNDVGLKLGGIAIATYLATHTSDPKARLMEYIGLATFLTSMAIYPKIAINAPAKILHGYDIDKQYIDDQGRKKSVQQDSNYVPYDMYIGANKGEDFDAIGDRMGIPRNIKNRHDVIREQMRKIATQNNTLWMLTAGFATPLMTALLCCGLEKYVVAPGLEKTRNNKYNSQIQSMLKKVNEMSCTQDGIKSIENSLEKNISSILSKYKNQVLPAQEVDKIKELIMNNTDSILSSSISKDLDILLGGTQVYVIDSKNIDNIVNKAKQAMQGRQKQFISKEILPSTEEIKEMLNQIKPNSDLTKGINLTEEEFVALKDKIKLFAKDKIEKLNGASSAIKLNYISNIDKFGNAFTVNASSVITEQSIEKLVDFSRIIGDFKSKIEILDKCENFKFEYAPETILANYYDKFQTTLIKQLEISPKDLKRISTDEAFAKKLMDEKISALCRDEARYTATFEKLSKIMSDMETALHGTVENDSQIKDLINSINNVYNNTVKRLKALNLGENTIKGLTNGEIAENINTREELMLHLDGMIYPKFQSYEAHQDPSQRIFNEKAVRFYKGAKGSSKNIRLNRLLNRYQGEANSFFRVFHMLDFCKRSADINKLKEFSSCGDNAYIEKIISDIKSALINASDADFKLKLGLNNKYEYKDLYNIGWTVIDNEAAISDSSLNGINKSNSKLADRFKSYIRRFKDLISNDTTYRPKKDFVLDSNVINNYTQNMNTDEAKFNLVAQRPLDMVQKGAGKMHTNRMWLKSVGIMTGVVFGVTLLAQFSFGKLNNKHNLQKISIKKEEKSQVKNETNT